MGVKSLFFLLLSNILIKWMEMQFAYLLAYKNILKLGFTMNIAA